MFIRMYVCVRRGAFWAVKGVMGLPMHTTIPDRIQNRAVICKVKHVHHYLVAALSLEAVKGEMRLPGQERLARSTHKNEHAIMTPYTQI